MNIMMELRIMTMSGTVTVDGVQYATITRARRGNIYSISDTKDNENIIEIKNGWTDKYRKAMLYKGGEKISDIFYQTDGYYGVRCFLEASGLIIEGDLYEGNFEIYDCDQVVGNVTLDLPIKSTTSLSWIKKALKDSYHVNMNTTLGIDALISLEALMTVTLHHMQMTSEPEEY